MADAKTYLNNFVKDIFEDNFAQAKDNLQSAIVEKLKNRMKTQIKEQYQSKTDAKCDNKKKSKTMQKQKSKGRKPSHTLGDSLSRLTNQPK